MPFVLQFEDVQRRELGSAQAEASALTDPHGSDLVHYARSLLISDRKQVACEALNLKFKI